MKAFECDQGLGLTCSHLDTKAMSVVPDTSNEEWMKKFKLLTQMADAKGLEPTEDGI